MKSTECLRRQLETYYNGGVRVVTLVDVYFGKNLADQSDYLYGDRSQLLLKCQVKCEQGRCGVGYYADVTAEGYLGVAQDIGSFSVVDCMQPDE